MHAHDSVNRPPMRHRTQRAAIIAALALLTACGAAGDAKTPAPGSDQALMAEGVKKMYEANDPIAAEALFRRILDHTPTHYGAHYQLATSLDRGGKPADARPIWDAMRKLAEAINDTATLRTVRTRLASPDTASQEAMMTLGLNRFYAKGDLSGAAAQFRLVLRRNPTHYGATFQLAKVLDQQGKTAEARQLWVAVLGMATQYKDEQTAAVARERLK
jgi:Flp pilus assembly protein TadD